MFEPRLSKSNKESDNVKGAISPLCARVSLCHTTMGKGKGKKNEDDWCHALHSSMHVCSRRARLEELEQDRLLAEGADAPLKPDDAGARVG